MSKDKLEVRFSHLLGYSGVGAVVVTPKNKLMIVEDTGKWVDKDGNQGSTTIPFVQRVKIALNINKELRRPPEARVDDRKNGYEVITGTPIPTKRFPTWLKCRKCGKMYPKNVWRELSAERCTSNTCGAMLEQVPYALVHSQGYISDVDWKYLAHRGVAERICEKDDELYLDITNKRISCRSCGSSGKFSGKEEGLSFGRKNQQPWLFECPVPEEFQKDGKAKIKKINDISIYSAVTVSALVIPPESRIDKDTLVAKLFSNSDDLMEIRRRIERVGDDQFLRRQTWSLWAEKYQCEKKEIEDAYNLIASGKYPVGIEELNGMTPGELEEDEYRAFTKRDFAPGEGEDFVIRRQVANDNYPIVDLIKADRLKEIKVFKGFTRDFGDAVVQPDIVGEADWLPAIELWGEGIFFTFDEKKIAAWERDPEIVKRFAEVKDKYINSNLQYPDPNSLTPRFILLHTLSHIIIRQLEILAGYPAASIKERIYSQTGEFPMAGILIYTTAPDKVGTLGGLAELAEPSKFYNVLDNAINRARWCSSDPVCSEHEPHGPNNLNRAACHACSLVPETTCAYGNALLDRQFLIRSSQLFGFGDR